MDTRDPKANTSKAGDDLGRHQHVLDAYLAHAGSDALPPPALDAKLLSLAARALNSTSTIPVETTFARSDISGMSSIKSSARARRRRWPFALAASVATIGFAAILARTAFQGTSGYNEPVYQTPSYEAKSAPAMQAPAAPAPLQQQADSDNREQAASVAMVPVDADKANGSRQRTIQQARGRIPAAPENSAPEPVGSGNTYAADTAVKPIVGPATSAPAPQPPEDTELAVSKLGSPSLDMQEMQDMRKLQSGVDAAPSANGAAETGVFEPAPAPMPMTKSNEGTAAVAEEKSASTASNEAETNQAPQAAMRSETVQPQASAPLDDATRTKKIEFAPEAQADGANPHAKSFAAIRALRDRGEIQSAKAMLSRFQKAYPQAQLPEDLAALAKEK